MNNYCPKCQKPLEKSMDESSGIEERFCPRCLHYESDSLAYKDMPWLFSDAGQYYLARKRNDLNSLCHYGFTRSEAEGWLDKEPSYGNSILKKLSSDENLHHKKSDGDLTESYVLSLLVWASESETSRDLLQIENSIRIVP